VIFEMLWLGSILLYAGLYLWGYVVNRLPQSGRRAAATGRTAAPDHNAAMSGKETPR